MTPGGAKPWALSSTARRTTPLPGGWKKTRQAVLDRDGWQCTWVDNTRCPATTQLEIDHIGDPEDHSLDNLRVLCSWHHRKRTGGQANAARWSRTRGPQPKTHPGLVG